MTTITKNKDRELKVWMDGPFITLQERERYLPTGYQRHKWWDDRILIHRKELSALVKALMEIERENEAA